MDHGPELNFSLDSSGPCSETAQSLGYSRFAQIAQHIRALPYGRVPSEPHGLAVLREGQGTCSSKHQFLAALARECGQTDVKLTIGPYRMSTRTNPGIEAILAAAGLEEILEAHCYLTYQAHRHDFTGLPSGQIPPFNVLIDERRTTRENLPAIKMRYHREALSRWARDLGIDPQLAWDVRERCIRTLSRRIGPSCEGCDDNEPLT